MKIHIKLPEALEMQIQLLKTLINLLEVALIKQVLLIGNYQLSNRWVSFYQRNIRQLKKALKQHVKNLEKSHSFNSNNSQMIIEL
jgi:hypothetical protein